MVPFIYIQYEPSWPAVSVYANYRSPIENSVSRRQRRAMAAIDRRRKPFSAAYRGGGPIKVDSEQGRRIKKALKAACAYPERYPHWWGTEASSKINREPVQPPREHLFRRRV